MPGSLPLLDLRRFEAGHPDRDAALAELRHVARSVGFFYLTGHRIPQDEIDGILALSRRFFALPEADKLAIQMVKSPQFRGYNRAGAEFTRGRQDWREQVDFGTDRAALEVKPGDPAWKRLTGPNQYPPALPELKPAVERWIAGVTDVGIRVLKAFAAALGQPESVFEPIYEGGPNQLLKIIHYPGRDHTGSDQGVGAHKDSGFVTILLQDTVAGLQVEGPDGWIDAPPVRGTFVVNTAAPVTARPLDHGAAIVVHSTTKYIGGHGTSIGGVIIDGGTFPWDEHKERFPLLNQPDPTYHGAIWTEAAKPLGPIAYVLRARVRLLRDLGAAISPFNAFQLIQGLETLPLRIRQHNANAIAVANFLSTHPKVTAVIHPSLQTGERKRRADALFKDGYGALLGFEVKGGRDAGRRFIDALKLFYHVANIGDARSLAIHPASTTHSQLSAEEQAATGVTPGYVRLSIGIEHPDDIIADLAQALDAA